jgi:hypothetical protein
MIIRFVVAVVSAASQIIPCRISHITSSDDVFRLVLTSSDGAVSFDGHCFIRMSVSGE